MSKVEVQFFVIGSKGQPVFESELLANPSKHAKSLDDQPDGGVIIQGDADARTEIGDMLQAVIQQVCLDSIAPLAAGQSIEIDLLRHTEQLQLSCQDQGARIKIAGDETMPEWYPRHELLSALVACAERYLQVLQAFAAEGGNVTEQIAIIEPRLQASQAALSS